MVVYFLRSVIPIGRQPTDGVGRSYMAGTEAYMDFKVVKDIKKKNYYEEMLI